MAGYFLALSGEVLYCKSYLVSWTLVRYRGTKAPAKRKGQAHQCTGATAN